MKWAGGRQELKGVLSQVLLLVQKGQVIWEKA